MLFFRQQQKDQTFYDGYRTMSAQGTESFRVGNLKENPFAIFCAIRDNAHVIGIDVLAVDPADVARGAIL